MKQRNTLYSLHGLVLMAILLLATSCHTPKVAYVADMYDGRSIESYQSLAVRLRTDDKLSIVVKSKDPLLSELFNLPIITNRIGYGNSNSTYSYGSSAYTVDSKGEIDFPVLGKIKVAGFTREELAAYIKQQLVSRNLVQDPVVTVEYTNVGYNVLGEVARPGRYQFDRDRLTLLDALSMAGDLTIQGRRDNVVVIRQQDGVRTAHRVNLLYADSVLLSPAFYLQQNDVVYVEPTSVRARQTTVNGNNVRSTSFWFALASMLISLSVLIFK